MELPEESRGSMRLIADINPSLYDKQERRTITKRCRPFYRSRHYIVEGVSNLKLKPQYQGQGLPNSANEVYAKGLCVKKANMILGFRYTEAYKDNDVSGKSKFYNPKLTKRFLFN